MEKCQTCSLNKIRVPNIVLKSNLCIVGESPGQEEEKEGRPFVGPSGKLLWSMTEKHLNKTRSDFAICNACQCQIPKEIKDVKSVLKHAIKNCREYLIEDLKKIKPKVIIAFGEIALSQVLGKWATITRNRGKLISVPELNCYVFPMYHPSFIIRNGGKLETNIFFQLWEKDWQVLAQLIENDFKNKNTKTFLPYSSNSVFKGPMIAIDAEWDEKGNLLIFSISDGKETRYITPDMIDTGLKANLRKLFHSKKIIAFANRPVDERILERYGIHLPAKKVDVFNMANLVNENLKISLENIVDAYLKDKHRIKDITEKTKKRPWLLPMEELIPYNCVDTEATAQLYQELIRPIKKDEKLYKYWTRFVLPVEDMLADITREGFSIDNEKLSINKREVEYEMMRLHAELISEIPEPILKAHQDKGLKLTRPDLLIDYLFSHKKGLKLQAIELTPTGKPSISEDSLKQYDHPWIKKLLEWKKLQKLYTTYFKGLERNLHPDGRIYPNLVLWGSVTGRTVCFNPNVQQVPRSGPMVEKLKELYKAPEGWLMGARDLSQSELRIVAWLSGERNMLKAMKEGVDLHTLTASLVTGKEIDKVSKEDRQLAKAVNFGLIYGASAKTLQEYAKDNYGLDLSYDEAQEFRDKFFKHYPALPIYHKKCIAIAREYGYIRSPLGRLRRLPTINSNDYAEASKAEREAINFPVQSFSSDLGLIGMYLFWRQIRDKQSVKLLWFIHDAVFFMAREDVFEKYMKLLKECMEVYAKRYIEEFFGIKVGYPIKSDGKAGKSWAELKDYHI